MITQTIYQCLSEVLQTSPEELQSTPTDANLSELGLTSLSFISFIVNLEEACNIEVLDSDLLFENFSTLEKLFGTLAKYFPNEKKSLKKVLILDADNVLWKGVCGEEEIVIDADILSFQKELLDYYKRGVLLCLCSKNEQAFVEQAFPHTSMLLKKEHFAVFVANRRDKVYNMEEIARQLNLSPDSFVFADDSDYELGFVALNLPEVTCIKVDHNTPEFRNTISELFADVQSTSDLNRTQLYREQKEREKEKHRFTTVQEYNLSLETKMICEKAKLDECQRLAELSTRTHQFNLSDRQYSEDELKSLLTAPDYTVLSLSVSDKYGDMGIVGMAVLQKEIIEAFMLSCRVFDRDLELVLLEKIRTYIGTTPKGIYRMTEKNQRYADFYPNNGVDVL